MDSDFEIKPDFPHPASEDADRPLFEEVDAFELGNGFELPESEFTHNFYSPENILQRADESIEEYIARFSKIVVTHAQRDLKMFSDDRLIVGGVKKTYSEILFSGGFEAEVDKLMDYVLKFNSNNVKQSLRSVRATKAMILNDIGYSPDYPPVENIGSNFFNGKIQNEGIIPKERQFLKETFNGNPLIDNRSYSNTLFSVPYIQNPKALQYLKGCVDNKDLLILGGGDSLSDLLNDEGLHPQSVVNIDPFLLSEDSTKNSKSIYRSINIEAENPDLEEKLHTLNPKGYEEVWSLYSVPFYTRTEDAMKSLVKNISSNLAPGGHWRIYPYGFPVFGNESEHETDLRIKSFQDEVIKLFDSGDFDIRIIKHREELGYRTLIITRKKDILNGDL